MKFLTEWWGINQNISPLEIAARSAVMFLVALLLMRATGMSNAGVSMPNGTSLPGKIFISSITVFS